VKVVVLTGGVGGAKFVLGLQHCGEIGALTAIVNTGDDFQHLGLHISPDIDTLLYTLSGQANTAQGWGREGESWHFMAALKRLGGPDWFNLGDGDLALHVLRTERLARGDMLSEITMSFATAWGIGATILPMSDNQVSTWLDTDQGPLPFQTYFVEQQCRPVVRSIRFEGSAEAQPAPGAVEAIASADAIFIAPSNPYLSIDPILAVSGIADALRYADVPVIVVSPLVGGKAVKGPTAKLMAEFRMVADNDSIAAHYAGIIDGLVHDIGDNAQTVIPARATATLMTSLNDKIRVARAALAFANDLKT
jgi:LPPG:FO 2-phospho-L-lactate transferase